MTRAKKQTFVRVIARCYDVTEDFAELLIQDSLEVELYQNGFDVKSIDMDDILSGLYLTGCDYANVGDKCYKIEINKNLVTNIKQTFN